MPRAPRVFVDGAVYHVYCRTAHGEPVFAEDAEAADLAGHLVEVARRDGLQVLAWSVMSNHYHLVVRSATVPLWRTMRLVQGRYAKAVNARRRTYGPVWQGRYGAKVVEGGRYLTRVIAYVHLNPVAAGLVRDPAEWRWSGHREMLGAVADPVVDVAAALAVFGDPLEAGQRSYLELVAELAGTPWLACEPGRLPWWPAGRRSRDAKTEERPRLDALGASTAPERPRLTAEEILRLAAVATGTGEADLVSVRSGSDLTRRRELIALVAVEQFGVRVSALAEAVGRSAGAVSRWIGAAGERRARDAAYRRTADELAAGILEEARRERAARSGFVYDAGADPMPR
jgi:REP element-mobilizing transposase RayT